MILPVVAGKAKEPSGLLQKSPPQQGPKLMESYELLMEAGAPDSCQILKVRREVVPGLTTMTPCTEFFKNCYIDLLHVKFVD